MVADRLAGRLVSGAEGLFFLPSYNCHHCADLLAADAFEASLPAGELTGCKALGPLMAE